MIGLALALGSLGLLEKSQAQTSPEESAIPAGPQREKSERRSGNSSEQNPLLQGEPIYRVDMEFVTVPTPLAFRMVSDSKDGQSILDAVASEVLSGEASSFDRMGFSVRLGQTVRYQGGEVMAEVQAMLPNDRKLDVIYMLGASGDSKFIAQVDQPFGEWVWLGATQTPGSETSTLLIFSRATMISE